MSTKHPISCREFGTLKNGLHTKLYTLKNKNGVTASVTDYGARLVSFCCPDKNAQLGDIVLGFDEAESYEKSKDYLGATVGRFANRIGGASFSLDGQQFALDRNSGAHHLHGGSSGFDSRIWDTDFDDQDPQSIRFSLFSPDGDQGYPGNLQLEVRYSLSDTNAIHILVEALCDSDTPISITNHSYFNLATKGEIKSHNLQLNCRSYAPLTKNQIPRGDLLPVGNSPFDFREPNKIGQFIESGDEQIKIASGYDHNFETPARQSGQLELAAALSDDISGRLLKVFTDAPGIQLYTANFLAIGSGKGVTHGPRHAVCLEPQHFPDAPNKPGFPCCIARAGEPYRHHMILQTSLI